MTDELQTDPIAPTISDTAAAKIGEAIAVGIATSQRRQMSVGEYLVKTRNKLHPNGLARAPRLKRALFVSARKSNPDTMSDEEIQLANRIHRGGRYLDRKVTVVVRGEEDGGDAYIDIRWRDMQPDDRMEAKSWFLNIKDLLTQIVAEQDEIEPPAEPVSRPFGNSKQTREARAAAAAREA